MKTVGLKSGDRCSTEERKPDKCDYSDIGEEWSPSADVMDPFLARIVVLHRALGGEMRATLGRQSDGQPISPGLAIGTVFVHHDILNRDQLRDRISSERLGLKSRRGHHGQAKSN